MWAKRFPVPEFDRYVLKNLAWSAPAIQDNHHSTNTGMITINGGQEYYDKFSFQGEHLLVVSCKLPDTPVMVSGNSFAWPIQRALITDSLDPNSLTVLADWITPRPMNTRLGPDGGISINSEQAYVMIGHRIADNWVSNRIMLDHEWTGSAENGFRILSSSEDQIDDFHDTVVYFEW